MSLFGAKPKSTFQKAKERLDKRMEEEARMATPEASLATEESSHIGKLIEERTDQTESRVSVRFGLRRHYQTTIRYQHCFEERNFGKRRRQSRRRRWK
jgi:hypothetical protein